MSKIKRRIDLPLTLTAEQAAELLNVHPNTIYEYAKQDKIPHIRLGKALRIDRDGLFWMMRRNLREGRRLESIGEKGEAQAGF